MKKLILIILMLICINCLFAQIKPTLFFTENDGLAGNIVRDILLDKKGILWIATNNGISRFDGTEFDNLNKSNGLPSNRVGAIAIGEQGEIYAGCSNGGLVVIRNDSVTNLLETKGKFKEVFRKLYYSKHYQMLFVGTESGFYFLQNKRLIPVNYNKDTTNRSIILSITERKSDIFFTVLKGKTQGFYQFKFNNKYPHKSYAIRISEKGRFALTSINGNLYSCEYGKLYKYNKINENPSVISLDSTLLIWQLCPYKKGLMWIGGLGDGRFKGEILLFDTKNNRIIPISMPQNIQSVNAIYYDSVSDVTWFGRDNGLMAFKESSFEYIDFHGKENILDVGYVGDSLLILTEERVLYYNENRLDQLYTKDKVHARIISELNKKIKKYGKDNCGIFDVSSGFEFSNFTKDRNKLYVQTGKGTISIPDFKIYLPFGVGSFTVMDDGSAYTALKYSPLYYYKAVRNTQIIKIIEDTLFRNKENFKILESNKVLYIESYKDGLFTIEGNKTFRLNETNSRLENNLRDMDKDPLGYIWCLSETNRLFQIDYKDKPFVRKDIDLLKIGLKGNNCNWIKFAGDKLYMATNEGLNVISLINLNSISPAIENLYNGFNGYKFISASSPILDGLGNIVVHTDNEIIKIRPETMVDSKLKINIYQIRIDEKNVDINDLLDKQLSYSTKQISFIFRGIKYPSGKNLRYRYKINNDGWVNGNRVNLQLLRAGNYSILMEISNLENNQIVSNKINFSISRPFWLTYWFFAILFFTIIILVYFIFRLRYNVLLRREEEKTKLLVQNSELQLRSLQIQMNPHFIFNALTSIQFLVLSQNIKDTLLYMNNLASIIRSNLETASKEFILVAEEIEFLKKYIQIELLRFKDGLEIMLQNNCQNNKLLMPPMLIQPLIENAIKHGIMPHKNGGKITILFSNDDNELQISVEDNGVGRLASEEIQESARNHFGLDVVEKRLILLNQIGKTNINKLEIKDLYKNNIPSGTKVIVWLAIKTI